MNFNFPLLRPLRILLFPISIVYLGVIKTRNWMYDNKILKSGSFRMPIICVGNIAAGGTGKSPMVEFLLSQFHRQFKLATLSRGYKRKTHGYVKAGSNTTALEIGDEPMQFHLKFPDVAVTVGEERIAAVPMLLHDYPETEVIILDDAFQHRSIEAGFNIVLTDYNNLYTRDWYLPTGDLRDEKRSANRADIIVVTKAPAALKKEDAELIRKELNPTAKQHLFFSTIKYGDLYHITSKAGYNITNDVEVLLVTGIANPRPIKRMLADKSHTYDELVFNDHHIFTIDDLNEIKERFKALSGEYKIILTTEKDAVRLTKFEKELREMPVYILPIEMEFLFNEADRFTTLIGTFIRQFSASA